MKRKKPETPRQEMKEIMKAERMGMSPAEMHQIGSAMQNKAQMGIDVPYIRTALFPEDYNFDMPQPMSNISYSRFTDKQETAFPPSSTGGNGSGFLMWYPKTTVGPSLFLYQHATGPSEGGIVLGSTTHQVGVGTNYSPYFAQTALVAASINLQYTGALQQESGYFVGGIVYDQKFDNINTSLVEESEFKVTTKPGDGIRIVYMPQDELDYQFYACTDTNAHNNGPRLNETTFNVVTNGTGFKLIGTTTDLTNSNLSPNIVALQNTITYDQAGPCIVIFWRGFPTGASATMRCETIRRFNGVPKQTYREIIDIQKPLRQLDAKKTTDLIYQLQLAVPQLVAHSMRNIERIKDQVQKYIPNLGHIYGQGGLSQGPMSMMSFAQQLALEESGQLGQGVGSGLIWE